MQSWSAILLSPLVHPANWPNIGQALEPILRKLGEYSRNPKSQVAMIDYVIGVMYLLRSDIEEGKGLFRVGKGSLPRSTTSRGGKR